MSASGGDTYRTVRNIIGSFASKTSVRSRDYRNQAKLNQRRVTRVLHSGSVARRVFIAAIIAISLGASIVGLFDTWDQSLQSGTDTEANVAVVALCLGVAFAVGTIVVAGRIRALSSTSAGQVIATRLVGRDLASVFAPLPTVSPPTVLRV